MKGLKIVVIPCGFFCLIPPGFKIPKERKQLTGYGKEDFPCLLSDKDVPIFFSLGDVKITMPR